MPKFLSHDIHNLTLRFFFQVYAHDKIFFVFVFHLSERKKTLISCVYLVPPA